MEKRMLLAVVLSFAIFAGFAYLQQKLYPPAPPAAPTAAPSPAPKPAVTPLPEPTAALPPSTPPALPPSGRQAVARDIVVDTPLYRAIITEHGARVKSFRLKKFWEQLPFQQIAKFSLWLFSIDIQRYRPLGEITDPKELIRTDSPEHLPLALTWQAASGTIGTEVVYTADQQEVMVSEGGEARLNFTYTSADGVTLVKTFLIRGGSYRLDMTSTVQNHTNSPLQGSLAVSLYDDVSHTEGSGFSGLVWSTQRSRETLSAGSLKEAKTIADFDWASLETGFFMMAAVPPGNGVKPLAVIQDLPNKIMSLTLTSEVAALEPGTAVSLPYIFYFGPKDRAILRSIGFGLEQTVDFGWFHMLALPLLYVLEFFYRFFHNWGLAIIALTIIIRILFIYPNHRSFKSMQNMQKLQPKIAKLREKYKDDREALNKELMNLYRTYKVNPLGGCLPMVLQLPVFIALYNILGYSIELRNAPFIATLPFTDIVWLADLSAKDPLLITPIIMGATMFIQQKMTPSPGDPAQAKMMLFMPIIFTFMFLNFASGLVLYWLLNNILAIIQQYYTNKYMS
ncbi:MAG: membrane protein insertase YidC [Desulfobacca sp.]|uniref:membrane protein insertase YidC n=1 Tax=Desulfobacca sp. TaxID=2067990 RepID=UPI00404B90A7